MLVIVLVVIAVISAFVSGVFAAMSNVGRVRDRAHQARALYRALRQLVLRRTISDRCDVCLHRGRCIDLRIADGSGGCVVCWNYRACSRRCAARMSDARDLDRRMLALGVAEDGVAEDDIPF